MFEWLEKWYISQCDEDWEHMYGIKITTIDNPGWSVTIDVTGTKIESLEISYILIEKSDNDWVGYSIVNKKFTGAGDSLKLIEIINIFRRIWEAH